MTCSDLTASPRNSCSHLRFLPPSLRQPAVSLLVEYYLMGLLYHQEHDGTKGLNKPSHSDSPSSTSPLPSRSLHLSLPWPCGQTHHPSPLSLSLPPLLSPSLSHDLRGGLPWWFHLLQLHRHAGCGMMGRDGAMAALSHPSSFCHQTHNEWRPRQLNHHRHNVGYDHDYDVSPYDHHDLRYTGGVLLLCGWGLWPAAGVRCCTCLPLLHARLHLSMMHLLLGDWAPPSWPWPRSSVCK